MKRLFAIIALIALFSGSVYGLASAKNGSGGQAPDPTPVVEPEPESEPATTPESNPVVEPEPVTTPDPTPQALPEPSPTPATTSAPAVSMEAENTAELAPEDTNQNEDQAHCGQLETIEERIRCRIEADESGDIAKLQYEFDHAYLPEGCRWGMETWQNMCIERYRALNGYDDEDQDGCWDNELYEDYDSEGITDCIKDRLGLPETIIFTSEYCGEEVGCGGEYRRNVQHMVAGYLYDGEQRIELLAKEGLLTSEETISGIVMITKAKLAFYAAQSAEEHVQILKDVMNEWDQIVKLAKAKQQ